MKFALYYIENLLEFVYAYIIGCTFMSVNYKSHRAYRCIAAVPLIFLFTLFARDQPYGFCITLICILYTVILYIYVFHICMADAILLAAMMFSLVLVFEGILAIILSALGISIRYIAFQLISNILLLAVSLLLYKYVPLNIVYVHIMPSNLYIKSLAVDICIALFAFMLLSKTNFSREADYTILFIFASFMISINVETIYYQKQTNRQAKELESYGKYLPIVEEMISYIRLQQHDFNNHLQAIQMLPLTHTDYKLFKRINYVIWK